MLGTPITIQGRLHDAEDAHNFRLEDDETAELYSSTIEFNKGERQNATKNVLKIAENITQWKQT